MATCDDPPVLVDALNSSLEHTSSSIDQKDKSDETWHGSGVYAEEDSTWIDEHLLDILEEEEDEDEEEEECEYEEDDEGEEEWICWDIFAEEEEIDPCPPDEDYDGPNVDTNMFDYVPSDASFVPSDLEERMKRRYMIQSHSFMELPDPHLETSLEPPKEPGTVDEMPEIEDEEEGEEEEEEDEDEEEEEEEQVETPPDPKCITSKEEKDNYKNLCKSLGIRPDPRIMEQLRSKIMDLRNMGMNTTEVAAVCKLLETNYHVEVLILAGNTIGMEGGMALAELVKKSEKIHTYDLAGAEILEAFEEICEAMSTNPTVMHLNFSKNELDDLDMPYIRKILQGDAKLTSLDLSSNMIKDPGLKFLGQGITNHEYIERIDLSKNKIRGEKVAAGFFTACLKLKQTLKSLSFKSNYMSEEAGKAISKILGQIAGFQSLDLSFNLMKEQSAKAIGGALARLERRDLTNLQFEINRWHQLEGVAVLKPFGNPLLNIPIEEIDFGMMMDVYKEFVAAKEKAMKVHPDMKIIHGQRFGMEHAKGPDIKELVIKRADNICKSFETPLLMLMEELDKERVEKEKDVLVPTEFRKFIKQCNLYKDKTLTDAFEAVFSGKSAENEPGVDAPAVLEAYDKVFPGTRKPYVPPPPKVEEEKPPEEDDKKKGKGKGKGGKGKGKKGKK